MAAIPPLPTTSVIATGFDKKDKEPLYNTAQTPTRRIKEVESAPVIDESDDNDDSDSEYELPPFLRNRNY